jgi:hypothetical protein
VVAVARYIVAIRRERRGGAPADWVERLGELEGVSVVGASSGRAQVAADEEGVQRLRDALGAYAHIEPVIEHRRV